MKVKDLCQMSMMLALLIVCSKISFNIGPIPITLQTLSVFITAYILGLKKSSIVFFTYIAMGLIGIPVFTNGGGYSYILQPSFGFILGFWVAAVIVNLGKSKNKIWQLFKSFLGLVAIYLAGSAYMYLILNLYMGLGKSLSYVLSAGVLPFILKDSLSVVLAYVIYLRIKNAIKVNEPEKTIA